MMNAKKRFFTYALLFMCCTFFVILSGCGAKQVASDTIQSNDTDKPVLGVSESELTYCVTEHGMLYPSGHLIRYYDFETDQPYILCDKANCSHGNEQCSAWYDELSKPSGLAIYKDKCYMFRDNYDEHTVDFISMDLTGNNQKILAQLDMGTLDDEGGCQLSSIGDVYYVKDVVWFCANYNYFTEEDFTTFKRIYQGIHLSDGSPIAIDIPDGSDSSSLSLSLDYITDNYLIFTQQHHEIPLLTMDEFAAECEKGTFGSLFENSKDSYYDYYRNWYPYNSNQTERYLLYSIDTGETRLLEEHPTQFNTDSEGNILGTHSHYIILGEYGGKLLCSEPLWDTYTTQIFLWDIEQNIKTEVPGIGKDGLMYYGQSFCDNYVIDNSFIFYLEKISEHSYDVFRFNLDTMQSSPKITEIGDDYFHLIADTPDMFIGRMSITSIEQYTGGSPYTIYKISKEDYCNGDLDKAVKLRLD